jgi:ketosteroid isomerase-like protein
MNLDILIDERDIRAVVFRYCRALDTKDWALLGEVFLPDATADLSSGQELIGLDAIVGRIEGSLRHLDESQHLVGNHEIIVDGDTASHRCYLQAQHVRHAAVGGVNYLVGGQYSDQFVRTPLGWRIRRRTLTVMWTEGNRSVPHPG